MTRSCARCRPGSRSRRSGYPPTSSLTELTDLRRRHRRSERRDPVAPLQQLLAAGQQRKGVADRRPRRLLPFQRGVAARSAAGTAGQDGHAARAAAWTVRADAPGAQLVDTACGAAVYCPA
jgi:hypothetical protein